MSLIILASSSSGIFPSWGLEEGRIASIRISPIGLIHLLLIFDRAGFFFVRHQRTVFAIYGSTADMKEGMPIEVFFNN